MKELTKLEKKLCYALRHKPEAFALVLDEEGFASAEDVCKAFGIDPETLEKVVEQSDKKRFELTNGKIRALYGHSIPAKIKKEEIIPPEILYHGTSRKAAEAILTEGLKPMKRQYVHLSCEANIAYEVGKRKDRDPAILQIDAGRAYKDGIVFYSGNERNVLVDFVPTEYIRVYGKESNVQKTEAPLKGIFWIVDRKNLENNKEYLFKIKSDREGNVLYAEHELTSKKGNNYNHKNTWKSLVKTLTHNKQYNYYPRGRVEIKNDTAKVFINPALNENEILGYIKKEYNLNDRTIGCLKIIVDNSNHYQSN